jgi:Ig-like domain from next to BRCA1 gene/3-keto-disaccharide hydrolase
MKSKKSSRIIGIAILMLAAALACNIPGMSSPVSVATVVGQTQTAWAVNQLLTPTTTSVPVATSTLSPSQLSTTNPSGPNPTTSPAISGNAPCTDMAKFDSETIPDGTAFAPGQEFIKVWTLRNVGTCIWNADYELVSVDGEPMGGTSPAPIGKAVKPNNGVQIYLPQKAPDAPGEHKGSWMLRNPSGKTFGLGAKADVAFWVKIQVISGSSAPSNNGGIVGPQNLGAPTWSESFDSKRNPWYLGPDNDISYDIQNGSLVMTAFHQTGDQWRVAAQSYLDDFQLQANFRTGAACSGRDGYGLLVRAPDKPSGNINSGYVFSFSCAGEYRIYRIDNGDFNSIVNWTTNKAIKPGPNQANSMAILAQAGKMQLFANGTPLSDFIDVTYHGGLFGLVIRSDATNNFQAFVDDIAFWLVR